MLLFHSTVQNPKSVHVLTAVRIWTLTVFHIKPSLDFSLKDSLIHWIFDPSAAVCLERCVWMLADPTLQF